jgi:hypothetical protein
MQTTTMPSSIADRLRVALNGSRTSRRHERAARLEEVATIHRRSMCSSS